MEEYFDYKEYLRITVRGIECYDYDSDESYCPDDDQQELVEDLKDRSDF